MAAKRLVAAALGTVALAGCGLLPVRALPSLPTEGPIEFRFDVENRTQRTLIVSVAGDAEAAMPEFAGGQRGSVSLRVLNPTNGIGLELIGPDCELLAEAILPTPQPFTLVLEEGADPTEVTVQPCRRSAQCPCRSRGTRVAAPAD